MISRTYGWVQNPADFKKLKLVVQIFDSSSSHYDKLRKELIPNYIYFHDLKTQLIEKFEKEVTEFSYNELVGTSKNKHGKSASTRAEAVADGIIQVTILPQSVNTTGKAWTDNWTSDGYLRWGLSLNFLSHDRDTDLCKITDLGLTFSRTKNDSHEEMEILRDVLLSYPPATQVLRILEEAKKGVTKFTIGNSLGFVGEKGFTSYDEQLMIDWFVKGTRDEQRKIKSDIEGTSDKYARMISSWLEKVGFVAKTSTIVKTVNGSKAGFQRFSITGRGSHALKRSEGASRNPKKEKYITWEFLAVDGKNRDYVRTRRAYILKFLKETKSYNVLLNKLNDIGFKDDPKIIENDVSGLTTMGIKIEHCNNRIELVDNICDFSIPELNVTEPLKDLQMENKKIEFLKKTNLPMKFIELLEIAFDGRRNRDFEIITAELFRKYYGVNSIHLGGGRKPDGIIFTDTFGVITDTKAYSNGYSMNINQADEMIRYIEDNKRRDPQRNPNLWWNSFSNKIPKNSFYFLWISSKFIGNFQNQILYTSNATAVSGGALNVEQLLLGADAVQKGMLESEDIPNYLTNSEVIFV